MQDERVHLILARAKRWDWVLIAILLLGLILRLWGINFGLPFLYHQDEAMPILSALKILHTGNLDPGSFFWPSLMIYLNALVYFGYFIFGFLKGSFSTPADLLYPDFEGVAVAKAASPEIILLGRGLSAIFGAVSVFVVYLICRKMQGAKPAGWFAAFLFAIEPISVKNSQFIRPDVIAIFFALVAFYFALEILQDPSSKNFILAGMGAGLAASAKYPLGLGVVPILVAHVIVSRWRALARREIYIAAIASAAAFSLTTPFAFLDFPQFLQNGPFHDANVYQPGNVVNAGYSADWYLTLLWSSLAWVLPLALGELALLLLSRDKQGIVMASFLCVYFILINSFVAHFDSTVLPVIPFLCVLAALFLAQLYNFVLREQSPQRKWIKAPIAVIAIFLALPMLSATAANDQRISTPDGRETARRWIEANLPPGSRIALEPFSPYLNHTKFMVAGFGEITEHTPDWYVSNGFEFLIFSQGAYGRAFANPERYALIFERYNTFFSRFPQIARFDDNDYKVLVYKTDAKLPFYRVGARFGDLSNVIELVGYDENKWRVGEPLHIKLFWRAVGPKLEPLELETRLLGENDEEIALVRNDLFLGKGWSPGMFSIDWTVPIPDDIAPGSYRLEIKVVQTRFGYEPPAINWADEKIENVVLGPFGLTPNQQ